METDVVSSLVVMETIEEVCPFVGIEIVVVFPFGTIGLTVCPFVAEETVCVCPVVISVGICPFVVSETVKVCPFVVS